MDLENVYYVLLFSLYHLYLVKKLTMVDILYAVGKYYVVFSRTKNIKMLIMSCPLLMHCQVNKKRDNHEVAQNESLE